MLFINELLVRLRVIRGERKDQKAHSNEALARAWGYLAHLVKKGLCLAVLCDSISIVCYLKRILPSGHVQGCRVRRQQRKYSLSRLSSELPERRFVLHCPSYRLNAVKQAKPTRCLLLTFMMLVGPYAKEGPLLNLANSVATLCVTK
jgi:hypothetical protein